jgi:hypothetical protein
MKYTYFSGTNHILKAMKHNTITQLITFFNLHQRLVVLYKNLATNNMVFCF